MSTETLALTIFAVILIQVVAAILVVIYKKKRQFKGLESNIGLQKGVDQEHTASNLTSSILPDAADKETPVWQGFKDFIVQRRIVEDSSGSVCSFHLVPVDGKPLPSFYPGQFLTFKLQISDTTGVIKDIVRCYSLSDCPMTDHYRVSIKRVPPPANQPELPPGCSSNYFHDQIKEGTKLSIKAPSGHFYLQEKEPLPIVLVGGGIGITPMLSMVNSLLDGGSSREIWLFYGVRNGSDHIMKKHLQDLQQIHTNFHLHVCYSRSEEGDDEGVDYQHPGHVDIKLLRLTLQLKRYQFYICGPRAMLESLVPALENWGVATDDIYYEAFGPATLPKHQKAKQQVSKSTVEHGDISVTFSKSSKTISWDPDAESLLDFAEDNNIEVDSGCRAGSCGSCETILESGEVDYNQDPDVDIESGHCLLCISKPKNDLKLTI